MGRPKKEIDPRKVRQLAGMGLTTAEIAAVLECSPDTLERRFAAVLKDGRARLCASLKRKQFSAAMKGNTAILIWLGKQYLGQSDRVTHEAPAAAPPPRIVFPEADARPGPDHED